MANAYPRSTDPVIAKSMRSNRRSNTKPELAIRSALHRAGKRFRKDFPVKTERRTIKPDVVFTRAKVCVFIDGCYWHGCPDHCRIPASNREYWTAKIGRNMERDKLDGVSLSDAGWNVVRIWEHVPVEDAVQQVMDELTIRG